MRARRAWQSAEVERLLLRDLLVLVGDDDHARAIGRALSLGGDEAGGSAGASTGASRTSLGRGGVVGAAATAAATLLG